MGFWNRSIRPPGDMEPNDNPPGVPPASVGPPDYNPGDPDGLELTGEAGPPRMPPPSAAPWDGWPAEWSTPAWGKLQTLADTAWSAIDLNARVLAAMPPYLVDAPPSLSADWLNNPEPLTYSSWEEFAKQVFWNFLQAGEVFIRCGARYSTGYPARFHVVPPHLVEVEIAQGQRRYTIGQADETDDILHIRYQSSVDDAHGHGPLEAGAPRLVAAETLMRYGTQLAAGGGIPSSVLEHPDELSRDQAQSLQAQWVQSRLSSLGEPAVLSGGVKWAATAMNPKDMALIELAQHNESRIAILLGVPPFLLGLPSGGDPMTYQNVQSLFDYHWRAGLRPLAQMVMAGLSQWALPRGTTVEVNSDSYVRPDPAARAQIYQVMNNIRDTPTGPAAMTVDEIREAERLHTTTPSELEVLG